MDEVEFRCGGIELIDSIRGMWERLTQHASERSIDFADHYASRSFEQRRKELRSRAQRGRLRIDIAIERGTQRKLGYCVSTVDEESLGTIESLFVHEDERQRGVGDLLIRRSLDWLRQERVRNIVVFVVYGNEDVLPFYHRYGFRPKALMLEMKDHREDR